MVDWKKKPCFVVASGPSLTKETAWLVRKSRWENESNVIVVNDAYKLLPCSDVLYAADFAWWKVHDGAKVFTGERWTSTSNSLNFCDDKSHVASRFDYKLVEAKDGKGFCTDGKHIHYGGATAHSGFQAINLAIKFGAGRIVLIGFDYGFKEASHFFGDHQGLRQATDSDYRGMLKSYDSVQDGFDIVNATPGSNLKRFPFVDLNEEIQRNRRLYWDRPEPVSATA